MKKKILTMLIGTMMVACLVACGSDKDAASNDSNTNSTVESASTKDDVTTEKEEPADDGAVDVSKFEPHDLFCDESLYPLFDAQPLYDSAVVKGGLLRAGGVNEDPASALDRAYAESIFENYEYLELRGDGIAQQEGYTFHPVLRGTLDETKECEPEIGIAFENDGFRCWTHRRTDCYPLYDSVLLEGFGDYTVDASVVPEEFEGTYTELAEILGTHGLIKSATYHGSEYDGLCVYWHVPNYYATGDTAVRATLDWDGNVTEYTILSDSAYMKL